jgi:hypothetical protein
VRLFDIRVGYETVRLQDAEKNSHPPSTSCNVADIDNRLGGSRGTEADPVQELVPEGRQRQKGQCGGPRPPDPVTQEHPVAPKKTQLKRLARKSVTPKKASMVKGGARRKEVDRPERLAGNHNQSFLIR